MPDSYERGVHRTDHATGLKVQHENYGMLMV